VSGWDREAYLWVTEHRVGWLDPLFLALTVVGYAGLVWIALAIVLPLLARRRFAPILVATGATVWSVDLFVPVLKEAIGRPRPFETLPGADPLLAYTLGDSFPSGHAATSFAGAVVLSLFFRRLAPALIGLATAIAFSRVYVGVHYPGDVLAGAALGAAWALGALALFRLLQPRLAPVRRLRRTPDELVTPDREEPRAYSGRAP
jgi:undecaprenyl-diphosphatase